MTDWYESVVDRRIREAREQGEFDNLPGLGRPLPDHGRDYDEDWWVKDWVRREGGGGALPPSLSVRRDVDVLADTVAGLTAERDVRDVVAELNQRIRAARVGLLDGPAVVLPLVDPDAVVRRWRDHRSGGRPEA